MPKKDLENTEAVAETVETTDPMKQMVRIKLPKDRENKQPDLFVGLNGKTYLIKRGEAVEVPLPVAEIIQHSEEQDEAAYEFISSTAQ